MFDTSRNGDSPQLLVSVRNAAEARAALDGGAQIIDVKEPLRGALGAADYATVAAVVDAVDARAPVTMAMGELTDLLPTLAAGASGLIPRGVALFKIGLAHCASLPDWQHSWRDCLNRLRGSARPVAVVYADWTSADAPPPEDVLAGAIDAACPALLIDTWQKGSGSLFDFWRSEDVEQFARCVQGAGIAVVFAGSLDGMSLQKAAKLCPSVVAVRGAACIAGRESSVTSERVALLRALIAQPVCHYMQ